jgi:ABC-type amino acid transport substrate-binding protein
MLRFLLFVILAWLVGKILRVLYLALVHSNSASRSARGKYGVGTSAQQPPAMEFKDVQDAEFEEITDPTKSPK